MLPRMKDIDDPCGKMGDMFVEYMHKMDSRFTEMETSSKEFLDPVSKEIEKINKPRKLKIVVLQLLRHAEPCEETSGVPLMQTSWQ